MRIMIVDDSKLIRFTIRDVLTRNFPHAHIFDAVDGTDALAHLDEQRPQIVLLDIVMPGMSGMDVLTHIKGLTGQALIQVIMISSVDDDEVLRKCFALGANDFVRKPISEVELCARIDGAYRSFKLVEALRETRKSLTQKNEDLESLNTALVQAKNQMVQAEKLAGIGQLAAGVAHEINNPVGFIASNVASLKTYFNLWQDFYNDVVLYIKNPTPTQLQIVEHHIKKDILYLLEDTPQLFVDTEIGVVRIKEIVNSLRSFSRVDQTAEFEEFDVNQGIRDALIVARNHYRYTAKIVTYFEEIPFIKAHGGKINQVMMNMIVNATDAIHERGLTAGELGTIEIRTHWANDHILISIKDDGIGMAQEIQHQIFNPFFTTKPIGSGTGLGLSVSYEIIVREHHGSINVSSEPNKGTTFEVVLPINQ